MDNCGMGGDLFKTPNVSSIAAIIASADGITFCKHGSPGNTDSVGSSDFLEYLGVNLFANKEIVEQGVEKYNFGYTDALDTKYKLIHVQSHLSAHLAHMNDIIGPITNPVNPDLVKKRIIGVNHLIEPKTVAEAYNILNAKGLTNVEHGLFVRGFADKNRNGGMDEISLLPGGTIVAELNKGEICSYELFADDFRLPEASYEDIKPRGDKKEFSKQILYGKIKGHPKNLILANTAIIEYLAHGLTLKQGVERANEVLESGKAVQNIEQYITHVGDLR
ncbi:MAG: hypothetical protein KKC26_06060 [Nanoarchaeota archaeon]|nr:hypothetical protein [Nanoarchaeota archaeon]